jgi:hypothetical protein
MKLVPAYANLYWMVPIGCSMKLVRAYANLLLDGTSWPMLIMLLC